MVAVEVLVTVLTVLFWILVGVGAFLLFALCTPLRISGHVAGLDVSESEGVNLDQTQWQFRIVWLLGLVVVRGSQAVGTAPRIMLRLFGLPIRVSKSGGGKGQKGAKGKQQREQQRREAGGGHRRRRRRGLRISWDDVRSLLPELRWLMAKMWHTLRIRAAGDLVYGFDDPATTAMVRGLRTMLPLPRELRLTPDFGEARLAGWARLQLTLYPMRSAFVMIRAVFRRGVRRIWWSRLRQKLPWARA